MSCPIGLLRISLISRVTFSPGRMAAHTGFGALADLDFDGVGVSQVFRRDTV